MIKIPCKRGGFFFENISGFPLDKGDIVAYIESMGSGKQLTKEKTMETTYAAYQFHKELENRINNKYNVFYDSVTKKLSLSLHSGNFPIVHDITPCDAANLLINDFKKEFNRMPNIIEELEDLGWIHTQR